MILRRRSLLNTALAAVCAPAFASLPGHAIVMGTGDPGGYYASYGPAWGLIAEKQSGLRIAFRASGGAAANILLIEREAAQLGMTTLTTAEQAIRGSNWTAGVALHGFRALFPMFNSVLQIVAAGGSGITTLADLNGRVIGIGPNGGSAAAAIPAILAALGVKPLAMPQGEFSVQMHQLLSGEIVACAFIAAPPLRAITRAANGNPLALIGLSEAQADHVALGTPGMIRAVLPAGTFPGQDIDVGSVGTANFAICASDLPAHTARAVTLAGLDNRKELARLIPAAATPLDLNAIINAGIPFHPGAADALRSLGVNLPDNAIKA